MSNPVKVTVCEPFPAGENPMAHDYYHMGTRLGKNVMILHPNHMHEECEYFYIVNIDTGERLLVKIKE